MVAAATTYANQPHHDYMGSHGMALIKLPDGNLLAHHMPLFNKPHDYQILYRIKLGKKAKDLISALNFVSILPDKFDLNRMIEGEDFTLQAKVFDGHFERGGAELFSTQVEFSSQVYARQVTQNKASNSPTVFDLLDLGSTSRLAIHRIDSKPSFDAVVILPDKQATDTKLCAQAQIQHIKLEVIQAMIRQCFATTPAYLEIKDFQ